MSTTDRAPERIATALFCASLLRDPTDDRFILAAEVRRLQTDRDAWKANHDNQVEIKRQLMDRPDLKERAASLVKLHAALSASDALCGELRDALDEAETIVAEHYGAGHPLRVKIASALAKTPEDAGAEVQRLRERNHFLETYTPKTNMGLIEEVSTLRVQLAEKDAELKTAEFLMSKVNPQAWESLHQRIETAEARNERLVAAGNAMRNTGEAMADLPGFIHTRKPNQHPAFTDWDKAVELYDAAKSGAQVPEVAALLEDKADLDWLEKEILGGDVSLGHYPFAEPNKERKWALVRGYIEHYADTARTAIRAARKEAR